MPDRTPDSSSLAGQRNDACHGGDATTNRVCPVCNGRTLMEIRGKLQCQRCHTICETCCEGGPT